MAGEGRGVVAQVAVLRDAVAACVKVGLQAEGSAEGEFCLPWPLFGLMLVVKEGLALARNVTDAAEALNAGLVALREGWEGREVTQLRDDIAALERDISVKKTLFQRQARLLKDNKALLASVAGRAPAEGQFQA